MRITRADADLAFQRYLRALKVLGLSKAGYHFEYREGSKVNGVSYKLVWVDALSGGFTPAPGAGFDGHIGWTRGQAVETIRNMARTLEDVAFLRYQEN